jgi:hypothetical protein
MTFLSRPRIGDCLLDHPNSQKPNERWPAASHGAGVPLHKCISSIVTYKYAYADHDDEELRSAAYELLGAVCTYLEYDKNPIIASQGACERSLCTFPDIHNK